MYQKATLDNGLRIVTQEMPHTYSASIALFFRVGSRYEGDRLAGVSHFIEHLLFKGTPRRPTAKEVAETIEEVGGVINAGTEKEVTIYWAKVAAQHRWLGLDLLSDITLHSLFQPEELEKERKVITEEIRMANDMPAEQVHMLIDGLLWPKHPLGRDIAGTEESVGSIQLDQVLDYYRRHYVPNNLVVAAAGSVRHDEVVEACQRHFGDWAPGVVPDFQPAQTPDPDRKALQVQFKETEQAHFCLSGIGLPRDHPDRRAQDLQNLILGGGMSSRLFLEIREEQALAYDVHSFVEHYQDSGASIVYAGTDPERVADCMKAVMGELARMRDESVPESELHKAKENFKGRMLLGLEDNSSVTNWLGGQEVLNGRILDVEEVTAEIDAVGPEDIQRVAQACLRRNALQVAVVGPCRNDDELRRLLDG